MLKYALGFFVFGEQNIQMNYYQDQNFTEATIDLPSEFINCTFTSIDFTPFRLSLCKFIECKFKNCNLSNVSVKNTLFRDCQFSHCKLIGLNFCETQTLAASKFLECSLDYSVFQLMNLSGSSFKRCSLKEADYYETNLSKCDFSDSHLEGAVFNKANLSGADFRGAQDYFIDLRVTNVKKAKFSLPEALGLLKSLDILLE